MDKFILQLLKKSNRKNAVKFNKNKIKKSKLERRYNE